MLAAAAVIRSTVTHLQERKKEKKRGKNKYISDDLKCDIHYKTISAQVDG
jgi:hypothetical protein